MQSLVLISAILAAILVKIDAAAIFPAPDTHKSLFSTFFHTDFYALKPSTRGGQIDVIKPKHHKKHHDDHKKHHDKSKKKVHDKSKKHHDKKHKKRTLHTQAQTADELMMSIRDVGASARVVNAIPSTFNGEAINSMSEVKVDAISDIPTGYLFYTLYDSHSCDPFNKVAANGIAAGICLQNMNDVGVSMSSSMVSCGESYATNVTYASTDCSGAPVATESYPINVCVPTGDHTFPGAHLTCSSGPGVPVPEYSIVSTYFAGGDGQCNEYPVTYNWFDSDLCLASDNSTSFYMYCDGDDLINGFIYNSPHCVGPISEIPPFALNCTSIDDYSSYGTHENMFCSTSSIYDNNSTYVDDFVDSYYYGNFTTDDYYFYNGTDDWYNYNSTDDYYNYNSTDDYYNYNSTDDYYNYNSTDDYYNYNSTDDYYNYNSTDDYYSDDFVLPPSSGYAYLTTFSGSDCNGSYVYSEGIQLGVCLTIYDEYSYPVGSLYGFCEDGLAQPYIFRSLDCTGHPEAVNDDYDYTLNQCLSTADLDIPYGVQSMFALCDANLTTVPVLQSSFILSGYNEEFSECESQPAVFMTFSLNYCFDNYDTSSYAFMCENSENGTIPQLAFFNESDTCMDNAFLLNVDTECIPYFDMSVESYAALFNSVAPNRVQNTKSKTKSNAKSHSEAKSKSKSESKQSHSKSKQPKTIVRDASHILDKDYMGYSRDLMLQTMNEHSERNVYKSDIPAELHPAIDAAVSEVPTGYGAAVLYYRSACDPNSRATVSGFALGVCLSNFVAGVVSSTSKFTCGGGYIVNTTYAGDGCDGEPIANSMIPTTACFETYDSMYPAIHYSCSEGPDVPVPESVPLLTYYDAAPNQCDSTFISSYTWIDPYICFSVDATSSGSYFCDSVTNTVYFNSFNDSSCHSYQTYYTFQDTCAAEEPADGFGNRFNFLCTTSASYNGSSYEDDVFDQFYYANFTDDAFYYYNATDDWYYYSNHTDDYYYNSTDDYYNYNSTDDYYNNSTDDYYFTDDDNNIHFRSSYRYSCQIINDPVPMPTPAPTTIPTFQPTVQPTNRPTPLPGSPTFEPTTPFPTCNPTSYPTANPTLKPISRPTVSPTVSPTANPTLQPTNRPTPLPGSPTFSPTSYSPTPSPSSNAPISLPTMAPTAVGQTLAPTSSTPVVAMAVTQVINGCSYSDYMSNVNVYQQSMIQAIVASFAGLVTYNEIQGFTVSQPSSRRKLQSSNAIAAAYSVVSQNTAVTYDTLNSQLTNSVSSGTFNSLLNSYASSNGATGLANAYSSPVTIAAVPISTDDGNDNNNGLSAAYIIIIVFFVLFGCALVGAGTYRYIISLPKQAPTVTRGVDVENPTAPPATEIAMATPIKPSAPAAHDQPFSNPIHAKNEDL